MKLSDENFQKAAAHIRRFQSQKPCPVCGAESWVIEGPVHFPPYVGGGLAVGGGVPVLLAVCNTCFFIRQFAWLPIERAAGGKKGPGT